MVLLANFLTPDAISSAIEAGGYLVLFGLLFACGLGLPLPEDIPLLCAGFLISQGKMHWVHASIVAWLGIMGGDCVLYSLGKRFGLNITRVRFVGKHLTQERILRAEQLFDRYGIWVVGVGRMFAGVRGAMVVAAGATRFNFIKFIIADGLATVVSGGLFLILGHWLGKKLGSVGAIKDHLRGAEHWIYASVLVVLLLLALYFWYRHTRRKALADLALEEVVSHTKPPASSGGAKE
jgi:membrane protein DedA with SNARE-associated domain